MTENTQEYFPLAKMSAEWQKQFGEIGDRKFFCSQAPGRVNLIGEHTDYHGGFVFPVAIDLKTYILASPNGKNESNFYSVNLGKSLSFSHDKLDPENFENWQKYIAGTAWAMQEVKLPVKGIDAVVWGTVPFGGGLSSSASVEVACIKLYDIVSKIGMDAQTIAQLGQKAENGFVGVPCGIMDQFASSACLPRHALMLDCASLVPTHVPIPENWKIVVCDTGVRHELASSEYEKRQHECMVGLKAVKKNHPDVLWMRDVSYEMLEEVKGEIPELSYRRCKYVLDEDARVAGFAEALNQNDAKKAGEMMAASHKGLKDEYEVSCLELDKAVELANTIKGLVGSRMTGGGFGGSTVNLVEAEFAEEFRTELEAKYREYSDGKGGALLLTPGVGAIGGIIDKL